ncbi:hypothetical protein SAMN05428949_1943 [Chitinophaga sp. YR627]|nr:hypothetical protein SAMN05428949_1943 [Chitinophaga sp. YR627]
MLRTIIIYQPDHVEIMRHNFYSMGLKKTFVPAFTQQIELCRVFAKYMSLTRK